MLSIARLAMKGPLAAALSATVYTLLALVFAPFLFVAGGLVCLSGLRHGGNAGLQVAVSAVLISGGLVFLMTKASTITFVLAVALVPLVGLAVMLRLTESQGLSITTAAILAFMLAMVMRFSITDVDGFWLQRLTQFRDAVEAQGGQFLTLAELGMVAGMMHASTILLVMLFFSGTLLIGRWWQASLYNPGGFGEEFRRLVLPRPVVLIAAALSVAALVMLNSGRTLGLVGDALLLVMILFAMQGLAIVHYRGTKKKLANAFFVFLYIFLVLLPHFVGAILTFVGIIDNVADFRKLRVGRGRG